MKLRRLHAQIGLSAVLIATSLAAAATPRKQIVGKQLMALYDRFTSGVIHHQIDRISALMMPNYTVQQPDGTTMTRQQVLSGFQMQTSMMRNIKWIRHITDLKMQGNRVIATVHGDFTALMSGQQGGTHRFGLSATTVDTWVHTAAGWKLQHSLLKNSRISIDGKPVSRPRSPAAPHR